jgi:hypothetical protein
VEMGRTPSIGVGLRKKAHKAIVVG